MRFPFWRLTSLRVRLVRDQANKTLDVYLQRVRKYGATLPDTVLPPVNAGDTGVSSTPRMGTAQNDTSWAGWAISSFTNKLTAARGDIQPRAVVDRTVSEGNKARQASIPPASNKTIPSSASASTPMPDRQGLDSLLDSPIPSTTRVPTSTRYFDEDPSVADEAVSAWSAMEDFAEPPAAPKQLAKPIEPSVPFEDSGEPDFAGWLAAQTQSKAKKSLPKGLTKKSETLNQKKPAVTSRAIGSSGSNVGVPGKSSRPVSTFPAASPAQRSTAVNKTVDTKPKDDGMGNEDFEVWGAEWE